MPSADPSDHLRYNLECPSPLCCYISSKSPAAGPVGRVEGIHILCLLPLLLEARVAEASTVPGRCLPQDILVIALLNALFRIPNDPVVFLSSILWLALIISSLVTGDTVPGSIVISMLKCVAALFVTECF